MFFARHNQLLRLIGLLSILGALCLSVSCASRGLTKSRSEIISEAKSHGIPIRSVAEDRNLFFQIEEDNRQRLISLISQRSKQAFRNANYRLGPSDEVEINVFDVPELNVQARVRDSGFVSLPLIGAIKAAGLSEMSFQDELTRRLKTYVKHPQVSVYVSHYGSQKVAVLGAVAAPGNYAMEKGANTLLEVISQAGGISEKAGNYVNFIPVEVAFRRSFADRDTRAQYANNYAYQRVKGPHRTQTGSQGIEVLLEDIMGTGGSMPLNIPVRGGDMVIIPEAGKVSIEGEVEQRGVFELGQRMTLLGSLAAAGGITYGANVAEIEIVREISAQRKARLVIDLERILSGAENDIRLRNGDLIIVPSDRYRRMKQDTFDSITKIINFGVGGTVNLAK